MNPKKPLTLWLFQGIALILLILHAFGFVLFSQLVFSDSSFGTVAGTVLNLGAVFFLVYVEIGIERRKPKARLGAIWYSGLLFIATVVAAFQSYEEISPEGWWFRLYTIGTYVLLVLLAAGLLYSLIRGKKVQSYFSTAP